MLQATGSHETVLWQWLTRERPNLRPRHAVSWLAVHAAPVGDAGRRQPDIASALRVVHGPRHVLPQLRGWYVAGSGVVARQIACDGRRWDRACAHQR